LPITTDHILKTTHDALAKVGENGPFVIIGHSMGGLFAANYYQTYPNQVKGIIQLDPTPVAWMVEEQATIGCEPENDNRLLEYETMFGLGTLKAWNPYYGGFRAEERKQFDPKTWDALVTLESQPKPMIASASSFHDTCKNPFALVRGPGSLGNLPVLKIVQDVTPAEVLAQAPKNLTPRERTNWLSMRNGWNQEYIDATTRGRLVYAGHGWGHYFALSHQDFTLAQIRGFLAQLDGPKAARP
jgi:pimeloyl-ACP methyl ester carboxylesterase